MLIKFPQKAFIRCGKNKIDLLNGDYIFHNGGCYQFVPKPHDFSRYYTRRSDGSYYIINSREMQRLLKHYKFTVETFCYVEHPYNKNIQIKTAQIITKYYFQGVKPELIFD